MFHIQKMFQIFSAILGADTHILPVCGMRKGDSAMEFDIDDLIYGDADPGPSNR